MASTPPEGTELENAGAHVEVATSIETYLVTHFGLEVQDIFIQGYVSQALPGVNSFACEIQLARPSLEYQASEHARLIGCKPIPANTIRLSALITRGEDELREARRARSQGASMDLISRAVNDFSSHLVPDCYGYKSMGKYSILLHQAMPGLQVSSIFPNMNENQIKELFSSMASIIQKIQAFRIPSTITGWGGVVFSDAGEILTDVALTPPHQPCQSLEVWIRSCTMIRLWEAEKSGFVDGWKPYGLYNRILSYINLGIPLQLQYLRNPDQRVLVHGLLDFNHLLCDETGQITGILGSHEAVVSHPVEEFLNAYQMGPSDSLLPIGLDLDSLPEGAAPYYAALLKTAFDTHGVVGPHRIGGFQAALDMGTVASSVMPWPLNQRGEVGGSVSDQERADHRETTAQKLNRCLSDLGF